MVKMAKMARRLGGFALPSVLIASIIMLTVLVAAVASTSAVRTSLDSQYYNQIAQTAAESGIAYAKSCLSKNNNVAQWSNSNPLQPNTDCTGAQLPGFTCPDNTIDSRCAVLVTGNTRSSFSVALPELDSSKNDIVIRSTGTADQLRTSDHSVWRQYTANSHLFINNPAVGRASTIQVLAVAGGGGGGGDSGGGGGGGGVVYNGSYPIAVGSVQVVVGAGGIGSNNTPNGNVPQGTNGGNSSFGYVTAIGGGGGGAGQGRGGNTGNGLSGGSGGGGGSAYPSDGTQGIGAAISVVGQGYPGASGNSVAAPERGGGGGGAGGAGTTGSTGGGNGGPGIINSISGVGQYYGGGGGGGSYSYPSTTTIGLGGPGGGGNGATYGFNNTPTSGTANTGGGGGSATEATVSVGGNGGSGIVIVSYPTGSITATGGTITYSGAYTIHTFVNNGTFTIVK